MLCVKRYILVRLLSEDSLFKRGLGGGLPRWLTTIVQQAHCFRPPWACFKLRAMVHGLIVTFCNITLHLNKLLHTYKPNPVQAALHHSKSAIWHVGCVFSRCYFYRRTCQTDRLIPLVVVFALLLCDRRERQKNSTEHDKSSFRDPPLEGGNAEKYSRKEKMQEKIFMQKGQKKNH